MIPRYTRPEIGRIWSEENRFRTWLAVSGIAEGPIFRGITRHGKMGTAAVTGAAASAYSTRATSGT